MAKKTSLDAVRNSAHVKRISLCANVLKDKRLGTGYGGRLAAFCLVSYGKW